MPEENGVAKRLNHTLLEHARAMLLTAQLPKNLWLEMIHHTVWLKKQDIYMSTKWQDTI